MVTKRVELPATAASARREREGKPQAAQQEHTEQGAGQGNVIPRRRDVKSAGGERPSLGQQQRSSDSAFDAEKTVAFCGFAWKVPASQSHLVLIFSAAKDVENRHVPTAQQVSSVHTSWTKWLRNAPTFFF